MNIARAFRLLRRRPVDDEFVLCPDCRAGAIRRLERCTVCGLTWDDLEAAAAFSDELLRDYESSTPPVRALREGGIDV